MPEYRLTPGAEADLAEIAAYTLATWGPHQAARYGQHLEDAFEMIAGETARYSVPIPHRPNIRCHRCQHHYVFSLHVDGEITVILAVLHENMDLPTRLRERLQTFRSQG